MDGSTFDHRVFRECLAWDNAGKKKEAPALYFCGFLSCTSNICGGFDVFPGSERMLASDDCSRIVCDAVELSDDAPYTSQIILNAIRQAVEKAAVNKTAASCISLIVFYPSTIR